LIICSTGFGANSALVDETITGQRFQELCLAGAKRFRRGKDLFHDGFATPKPSNPRKKILDNSMTSHV
jgi:hypothetical protein